MAAKELEGDGKKEMGETLNNGTDVAEDTEYYEGGAWRKNPVLLAQWKEKLAEHVKKYKSGAKRRKG